MSESVCGLVPVYNNPLTIGSVVKDLRQHVGHVIIVDDGSDDETRHLIDLLADRDPEHVTKLMKSEWLP